MSTLAAATTLIAGRKLVGGPTAGHPGRVDATAVNKIGSRNHDQDGNEYIYLSGVASTAIGSWVVYDEAGATILLVTTSVGPAAIATAATIAGTSGWYAIAGSHPGLALTGFVDNATVNGTATAGSIDDNLVATAAESQVFGAIGRSAVNETSLLATFQIYYPYKSLAVLD